MTFFSLSYPRHSHLSDVIFPVFFLNSDRKINFIRV